MGVSFPLVRVPLLTALFATLTLVGLVAQPSTSRATQTLSVEARWQRATDAWEAGAYPAALEDLRAIMRSAEAADYLARVALLTGERFTTTELSIDGRNPRISANGQFATYETGPTAAPVTRLVSLAGTPKTVADLPTTGVVFNRAGTELAWIRTSAGANARGSEIVVRDLAAGNDRVLLGAGLLKTALAWSGDDQAIVFIGAGDDATRNDVYRVRAGATVERLTDRPGFKANVLLDPTGAALVYQVVGVSPFGRGGGAGRAGGGGGPVLPQSVVVNLAAKTTRTLSGSAFTMSANGRTVAWLVRESDTYTLRTSPTLGDEIATIRTGRDRIDAPALSPDGTLVAYQLMTGTDWEIYVSDAAGAHRRLTRDLQHDLLPRFLTPTTVLTLTGEARHRRAHLYDVTTGARTRLFANNTIRTISPEYAWVPSADGQHVIVQADRDGDTTSAERGVYVVDLSRPLGVADIIGRLDRQRASENELRQRMTSQFRPLDAVIRRVVGRAAINQVYTFEKALFDFDSKYITQPGNQKAIDYLARTYRSFGYAPELQKLTPPQLQGNWTANVVAMKRGTENPDLVYVVSSHFDSVSTGPGADDNTSGTAALLETARLLADVPLPATVVFASFTGEEAGLLGSREFVRLAAASKWNVAGALNNDMIGWGADSARMDNTIRYSNAGIRDLQHGAAFLFSDLVTYDAKYYRSTDAQAFFDGWGDIVGGIGSYPVLANPNYHQPTDLIETVNVRQIMETAKVTAATLVYLASSPSRLKNLKALRSAAGIEVTWAPSPEQGVRSYLVAYGPAESPLKTRVTVSGARAVLPVLPAGTLVGVKAVNARGLEGWDWARTAVP